MGIKTTVELEFKKTPGKQELEDTVKAAINRTFVKFPNERVVKILIETYLYTPKQDIIIREKDEITNE